MPNDYLGAGDGQTEEVEDDEMEDAEEKEDDTPEVKARKGNIRAARLAKKDLESNGKVNTTHLKNNGKDGKTAGQPIKVPGKPE